MKNKSHGRRAAGTITNNTEKYLAILQELPDIVYKIDPGGFFTFINKSVSILGYRPEELIGEHFRKIIHPDDVRAFSRYFVLPKLRGKTTGAENAPKLLDERRTGERKTKNLEIRLKPKNWSRAKDSKAIIGTVIAFGDVSASGYYDPGVHAGSARFLGTLGIIRDITERKKAEDKIRYQADMLGHVSDAIISTDLDFNIRTWNKAAEEMYGWKTIEVVSKPVRKVTKLEYPYDNRRRVVRDFFKHGYWKGEVIQKRKDGTSLNVLSSVSLIKDIAGTPIGVVAVNRDITKRKQIEERIRESEEEYRNIVELAPDAIITLNRKGVITMGNSTFSRLSGYSKNDIVGKHFSKLPTMNRGDLTKYFKTFASILRGKRPAPFEIAWIHKNGSVHHAEVRISVMRRNEKIDGLQVMTRDLTETKKREVQLRNALTEISRKNRQLDELANRITAAQEDERLYITSEIHDDLLQDIVAVKYFLQLIDVSSLDKQIQESKEKMLRVINKCIDKGRTLIKEIGPIREPETSLTKAVKRAIDSRFAGTAVEIDFRHSGALPDFNAAAKANMVRVVQEALMNVYKHAKATRLSIRISRLKEALRITVKDNGVGFNPDVVMKKKMGHYGLLVMQGRANTLGGTAAITSKPGHGTIVEAVFPLNSLDS